MKAIFLAALLLLAPAAQAAEPSVTRMEEVIGYYAGVKLFMGTVLIVKGNTVILDKAYGSADLEWNIPNTIDTKFRIGSITKQFTAAAVLLLEERGKLKTTDPIRKYLPDLPAAWDKITIFNLLTHSSGIYNYTSLPAAEWMRESPTHEQVIDKIKDKPLDFTPGEKYSYSNTGYFVLGMLIEKLSGQTYAQFLQDNIFTPLGMKDSGYDTESAIIPRRAQGYQRRNGELLNDQFLDMTTPFAAGGLYSTTHDLLAWQKALFAGKVVKPASFKKMTTPYKDNYAFGLLVMPRDGHRAIGHNGGINGFTSNLMTLPDDGYTVILLNNAQGFTDEISDRLIAVLLGKPVILPSERKEVTVDAKNLARYVGRYQLRPDFILEITQEGNTLTSQAAKQPKNALFAESQTDFFTRNFDSQVTFVVAGDGPASALVLHQGGRDTTAKRVP
jgi:CubicO group peptidase (beta-lactamase class C family)